MQTAIREHKGYCWIKVPGPQLDYANAYALKNTFLDLIRTGQQAIVVDLSEVEAMDSKGLSTFLFACRALGDAGGMVLTDLHPSVRRIFALTRVDQIITIYADQEQIPERGR